MSSAGMVDKAEAWDAIAAKNAEIARLRAALKNIAFLRPAGATPKMVRGTLIELIEKIALAALSTTHNPEEM